jgi:hypothetical protein
MSAFPQLEQRIDALCARVSSGQHDPALLAEIDDLLAEGYIRALQGDAVARDDDRAGEATRQLRVRLAVMYEHWFALQASLSD